MSLFDNKPFDSHSKHATGSTASGEILSIWMRNTLLIQSVGCTPKTYQADVPEGPVQIPFQMYAGLLTGLQVPVRVFPPQRHLQHTSNLLSTRPATTIWPKSGAQQFRLHSPE